MIKWYTSKSDDFSSVIDLCNAAADDNRPAAINMDLDDWKNKNYTLMYKLCTEKSFDTGGYGVRIQNGMSVAGSGYYLSDWGSKIYVTSSRSYTVAGSRIYLIDKLFNGQIDHIKNQNGKIAVITFNDYNSKMIKPILKINDPTSSSTSFQENGIWYRKKGKRIQPFKFFPHQVMFNHTEQWMMYSLLDPDFEEEFLYIASQHKIIS